MDNDAYPRTLPHAMKLLEKFKPEAFAEAATGEPGGDSGVAFAQTESYVPTCFNCCVKGHTVNEYPKFMLWGEINSGLTENQLATQKIVLPILLSLMRFLPQHLHPHLLIIRHQTLKDFKDTSFW